MSAMGRRGRTTSVDPTVNDGVKNTVKKRINIGKNFEM